MRLGARSTQRLTNQLRLALEPECLENQTATAREDPRDGAESLRDTQAVCGFRYWASKHTPLFHTINTIVAIFLAKVSRAISGRMPLANNCRIELREGTGLGRSHDRRSLEKILQIVIVISVQSANLDLLLLPFELSFHNLVISAAAGLDADTAIGP